MGTESSVANEPAKDEGEIPHFKNTNEQNQFFSPDISPIGVNADGTESAVRIRGAPGPFEGNVARDELATPNTRSRLPESTEVTPR